MRWTRPIPPSPDSIRPARAEDCRAIRRLLQRAFPGGGEAALVEALRAGGHAGIELVAEEAGRVAGHLLMSRMAAPTGALGLGPVATAPEHRRQGVASALLRHALAAARRDGWLAVFVLGEPAFYGRFGFSARAAAGWASPYAGPYFMALELAPGALAGGGTATYPPPFDEL